MKKTKLIASIISIIIFGYSHNISSQTLITHSSSQTPVNGSIACRSSALLVTNDNRYYREFDLANDFGISSPFQIDSVQFAIEVIFRAPTSGFPVGVNLYTVDPPGLPTGTLTPLADTTLFLNDQLQSFISIPLEATINAGDVVVMEIDIPNSDSVVFLIGSNPDGQSDFGYLSSDTCDYISITELGQIASGFPNMHMIMNLKGSTAVNINEIEQEHVLVYPNPAKNQFNVSHNFSKQNENIVFNLFDITGQKIFSKQLRSNETTIRIRELKSGIYIYNITQNDVITKTNKLIIK
jgi:hypothetical protein